ncbi:MAG TPA: hypothetical protein VHO67_08330 [Polyangia bacterium]|nr:hypothetical protein [Polyangia bacterium]
MNIFRRSTFSSTPTSAARIALIALLATAGCAFKGNKESLSGAGGGGPLTGTGGGTGGTPQIGGLSALQITPGTAMISVSTGAPPATQQFMVTGTINGQSQDVTSMVTYSVTPTGIVTIDASGLATSTGTSGGVVTVTAASGSVTAQATLVVNYTFTGADPGTAGMGIPSNAGTLFSSAPADPTRAPQLVYPNDGALFPPNVTGIEVHFVPGAAANTLFQVSFVGKLATVNTFIRCAAPAGINGCIYLPDPGLWATIASANAGQGPVKLHVSGTDDNGTAAGTSSDFTIQFSKDNILGALYYWTTSGKTAIMRWDFAGSTAAAMPYLTPTNTDGKTCVGCHALAPDGSKIVASAGGQSDGRLLLWDIKNNMALQPFPLTQKSQFESWNADGTQFVGVYGDGTPNRKGPSNLMIFDGTMGTVVKTIDLGGLRADHPDWSKNPAVSNTIVFTSMDPNAGTTDQRPATGAIDMVTADSSGTWGAPQELVPAVLGKNHYYPAIAPDGNLVVYDESTCTKGTPAMGKAPDITCDADTDATATMFLTSLTGAAPVALTRANSPGVGDGTATALTNSFPKWAPYVQSLDEMNKLIWLTFSSTRQYGLRTPPAPADTSETTKGTLIWMVGINPGAGGADPSYAAFCLPFQDVTTSNHIAQWTKYFIQGPG